MRKLFSKKRKRASEPIVLVSGLPRSGTSMMMRMLSAGGLKSLTDNIRTADDDNPEGYYEFERAKKLREGDTTWLKDAQGYVVKTISALLEYLPENYEYKVIFMRRTMPEILASQKKMLVNRGEDPDKVDDAEMSRLFKLHLDKVTKWLETKNNFKVLFVHYNDLLTEPGPIIQQINNFFDGALDSAAMASVIDPSLYRQRRNPDNK